MAKEFQIWKNIQVKLNMVSVEKSSSEHSEPIPQSLYNLFGGNKSSICFRISLLLAFDITLITAHTTQASTCQSYHHDNQGNLTIATRKAMTSSK